MSFGAIVLLAAGAAACDPIPPAPAIVVTTTASGGDADPGDGVCEMTPGQGDCSLPAAVDEGNALGRAAITAPAGFYKDMTLVIAGELELNWGHPAGVLLHGLRVSIEPEATLRAAGLGFDPAYDELGDGISVTFSVAGHLELDHSNVRGIGLDADGFHETAVHVLPGGSAVVTDSIVFGGEHAIHNEGNLVVARSTLLNLWSGRLNTTGAGASILASTLVQRAVNTSLPTVGCAGTVPTSLGYNYVQTALFGCGLQHATDQSGFARVELDAAGTYTIPLTHPGVDAIPLGTLGCTASATDVVGQPRGIDGNGDGVPGCDIGALERQP